MGLAKYLVVVVISIGVYTLLQPYSGQLLGYIQYKERAETPVNNTPPQPEHIPYVYDGKSMLDIVFCVDTTGSMSPYIEQAKQNIQKIIRDITAQQVAVRFGLVEYRDVHDAYVVREHDFTTSVSEAANVVNQMSAAGGGDGPEAVAPALSKLLALNWGQNSTKIVIFIADAPPHGLEAGDKLGPDGLDPLQVVQQLKEKGIIVYSVGCEPAIQGYVHARAFMKSTASITGGRYLSLARADLLTKIIVGGALEEIELENISEQVNQQMREARESGKYETDEEMFKAISMHLEKANIKVSRLSIDEVEPEGMEENLRTHAYATIDEFLGDEHASTEAKFYDTTDSASKQTAQLFSSAPSAEQVKRLYSRKFGS